VEYFLPQRNKGYGGAAREVALGACPRETLDAIRETFAEIRLRVSRGGDPAGQRQTVTAKVKLERAQVRRQLSEEATRQQHDADQQRTISDLFSAWSSEAFVEYTPKGRQGARRMFELHLLPLIGAVKVIDADKIATAINLHIYIAIMFNWALRRKPWLTLLEDFWR
jgi:hypothetical protein